VGEGVFGKGTYVVCMCMCVCVCVCVCVVCVRVLCVCVCACVVCESAHFFVQVGEIVEVLVIFVQEYKD